MKKKPELSNSYMQLGLHIPGKESIWLRVPTLWDGIENQWIGFIKTPISHTQIVGKGKTSIELETSFNRELKAVLEKEDAVSDEVFDMFKPMSYWEKPKCACCEGKHDS